ncbi:peptidylprolyl isomerase [Alteriqipengyuania lutimaris]|uniref:Parvulin-like PPIase n=1 Tax=Alteriqipengyuania lutimaris TaxID=1538146 RepID=A0A395LVJ9_9SPHN|nr:peptidylprolyl isomerase [Alteriqipengyuania lutimaris]
MLSKFPSSTLHGAIGAIAASALAILPVAAQAQQAQEAQAQDAQAQEAQQASADDPFGFPTDGTLFGQQDPNKRTATAKVNGAVITGTDIDHRVALVLAASERTELAPEEEQQLRMQVLRNLIDETLQIQAAAAQELPVSQDEVEQRYRALAQQNFAQNPSQMDAYLIGVGSSPAALKRQIQGEIAWNNLLRRNVAPFINVSAEEVNDTMERLKTSRGQSEYRLAEIYLSATPETAAAVQQNAARIIQQIREGGSFQAYARQFSESTTAAVGGDLGFVRLATLPEEMAEIAQEMQPGQLVGPVQIPGGYVIMLLVDKQQVLTADPRDAVLSLKQISIGMPAGLSQEEANARVKRFSEAVSSIRGCGDANRIAETVGADVVDNNSIRVRDLPEQLQGSMLQLQVGQATPPFGSLEEGVRVLLLCGRDDPETGAEPDFDQIMDRIEEERISKRAQRFLRDLRNDAIIEYN